MVSVRHFTTSNSPDIGRWHSPRGAESIKLAYGMIQKKFQKFSMWVFFKSGLKETSKTVYIAIILFNGYKSRSGRGFFVHTSPCRTRLQFEENIIRKCVWTPNLCFGWSEYVQNTLTFSNKQSQNIWVWKHKGNTHLWCVNKKTSTLYPLKKIIAMFICSEKLWFQFVHFWYCWCYSVTLSYRKSRYRPSSAIHEISWNCPNQNGAVSRE